jgi:xanthosine utilization system XapX-like protein
MDWIIVGLLFLGFITPFSLPVLVVNGMTVGFVFNLQKIKKRKLWLILMLGIYGVLLWRQWGEFVALLGLASFYFGSEISNRIKIKVKWKIGIALGLMVLQIILFNVVDGKELRKEISSEPQTTSNMTDMGSYLKTYYRIKRGEEFYSSFAQDIKGRLNGNYPHEIWGWKQPLIFYIWNIFSIDGGGIINLATVVFGLDLILIYLIGKKFLDPVRALLCPLVVLAYFHYPFDNATLLQVEWWSLSFFIAALYFYFTNPSESPLEKERIFDWLTGIFFVLTLAVRELFAIPIICLVLIDVLQKKWKKVMKLVSPTLLGFFPYFIFYHVKNILRFEEWEVLFANSRRTGYVGSWSLVRTTLAYNSWSYILGQMRPFLFLLIINTGIIIFLILKNLTSSRLRVARKNIWRNVRWLSLYFVFFLISFKIGIMDVWHDYWGIYYVPLMLALTPIILFSSSEFFNAK